MNSFDLEFCFGSYINISRLQGCFCRSETLIEFCDSICENNPTTFDHSSSLSGKTGEGLEKDKDSEENVINIFSVATGHLYERLLRIMMLSVLKNTESKVKFWFLKNYLSPSMKDILPYYAKRYGFEYQLVEYKWPRWLNQQTEKQRLVLRFS